jgi:hypothetical protein
MAWIGTSRLRIHRMTRSSFIDIAETVFPVVATLPGSVTQLARPDFFGTAFAVGRGVYMTAEHVLAAALKHGQLALEGPSGHPTMMLKSTKVSDWESWPDRDVALLYCDSERGTLLDTWLAIRVQLLTDLSAFGYPHAVTRTNERDHFEVVFRGYKGHVIAIRGFDRLPGKPAVYEISCPYPEGLSGAPVLLQHRGAIAVAGVVVGSQTISYGGAEHSVGIAMIADEILELPSARLRNSIGMGLGLRGAELRFDQ